MAKDKAYLGYKSHVLCGNLSHAFYANYTSLPNTGDAKHFIPLMEEAERFGFLDTISKAYGDCAYNTGYNREWLESRGIDCCFHNRDESGLNRTRKRSAKKKSRVRSLVEALFGIAKNNLTFEKPLVHGIAAVRADTDLVYTAWNTFMCFAFLEGRWVYRTSVKTLFY